MIGLLAAIPAIVEGISTVSGLFETGKKVYEEVTGAPSKAATHDELIAEIDAAPPEQQRVWVERMTAEVDRYRAETERIRNEQGEVTAEVLAVLPPEVAGKVAYLRMTTRPWAVRLSMRAIAWPALGIVMVDGALQLLNILAAAFGWLVTRAILADGRIVGEEVAPLHFDLMAATVLAEHSGFMTVYSWLAPSATTIVLTYITAREVGKARGTADSVSVADVVKQATGLVGRIRGAFK